MSTEKEPPQPWERLPRESAKAFEAFGMYLELGTGRSIAATARKCSKSGSLLGRWSRKFSWEARAKAYAGHLGMVSRRAGEMAAAAVGVDWILRQQLHREDEWAVRAELLEAARKCLAKFKDGSRGATLGDVARALDLVSKLGRVATGLQLEGQTEEKKEDASVLVMIETVLDRVYGGEQTKPASVMAEVVDVSVVPSGPVAAPEQVTLPERAGVLAGLRTEEGGGDEKR